MQLDAPDMQQTDAMPAEIQDLLAEMRLAKTAKIEQIGKEVAKKRDEAVKHRKASGIETIWAEDEEYYQGIDDANRESHAWLKSASSTGGISRTPSKSTTRCTSFFNITRQFVESASARMGDILLPAGDWNFTVKPSPVQDGVAQGMAPPAAPAPVAQPQPAAPMGAPADPMAAQQPAPAPPPDPRIQAEKDAVAKAEKAELKIRDWMVECSYHTEVRKVIEDAAKLGTGILKGPFPDKMKSRKVTEVEGKTAMEIVETTNPSSRYVDCWDFFPDPACGDDIHNGSHTFERDRLSARQLKDLKGLPGYLSDQIDSVLDEGPGKKNYSEGQRQTGAETEQDDKYEIWYFYGLVDVAGLSAMNVQMSEKDSDKNMLPAVVTLVNDTPIKAFVNPLDTGEFPYDLMPWQRVAGTPWGIGVARQGRTAQDMLNASCRALMDNAGLSSGPMIIMRQNAIVPADGKWEITARKVWYATEQADVRSVADAFTAINIPMVQAELTAITQMAYKMMEDATGITFLLQGQQGSAPDTVGGMELLHRNASAILRRLARVFDERVTEPHVRRYYEYLLLHGPDDCKGDMKIEAIGSTALVEREIQAMESMVLLQMAINPAYGLDPEKAMVEVLKTKRFIPEKWTMDDAKKQKLAQQQPSIPAIEVQKLRSADAAKQLEFEQWKTKVETTNDMKKAHDDIDRDLLFEQTLARRDQTTNTIRMQELQIKRDLAMLEYSTKRNISLDQIKAELARESMRLRTQKELAGAAAVENRYVTPQVAVSAVEPPQHAPDGQAFQQ